MCWAAACTDGHTMLVQSSLVVRKFTDLELADFWDWDEFSSYLQAWLALNFALFLACAMLLPNQYFIDLLGSVALGVEAMLAVPQAWRNYKQKSVQGLRYGEQRWSMMRRHAPTTCTLPLDAAPQWSSAGQSAMPSSWFVWLTYRAGCIIRI